MLERSLPLTVAPIKGECLKSFLHRSACVYGVSADRLLEHCLGVRGQGGTLSVTHPVDRLTVQLDPEALKKLSETLRISKNDLGGMTLKAQFPSIGARSVAQTGAGKNPETKEETSNEQLQFGWCPLCLMEDRAEGGHHFLRLQWSLASSTICQLHQRPLIGRCQTCYHFVPSPDYALYRDQMALICPHCHTPLDGRLGYDFVADKHAHVWNADPVLHMAWNMIAKYEQFFRKIVEGRAGRSKGQRIASEFFTLLDYLLQAENPNHLRPVDMFDSTYFPSITKLGFATRHLQHPFHVCHLVERRKALAIVISMLEDTSNVFGFEKSATPLHRIRELMSRRSYNRFERHILNIARLALPK